jgi:hypothetical protein
VCGCAVVCFPAANRHAKQEQQQVDLAAEQEEAIENPSENKDSPEAGSRLPLDSLLSHLSGLTRLTHLHISSTAGGLQYSEGELLWPCRGLLRQDTW